MATLKELREERRLVKYAIKGDKRSLERLILKYINFCYSVSLIFLEEDKLAKKALEDALTTVYTTIEELYDPKGFKVWLYDILKKSIDNFRQKGKMVDTGHGHLKNNDNIDYLTLYKINSEEVQEAKKLISMIRNLPDEYKEIIVLVDFEGLSCTDTAILLGEDVMDIRKKLYIAKNNLKPIFTYKPQSTNFDPLNEHATDSEKGQVYGIDQLGM